jgi:hypothetical protein
LDDIRVKNRTRRGELRKTTFIIPTEVTQNHHKVKKYLITSLISMKLQLKIRREIMIDSQEINDRRS